VALICNSFGFLNKISRILAYILRFSRYWKVDYWIIASKESTFYVQIKAAYSSKFFYYEKDGAYIATKF
jgi:hypothetical protein